MGELMLAWLQFGACAILIAAAGTRLSLYGDIIADKSGWSGGWVGLFLLATVTSLPELATGISSVALAGAPNIAAGDILGSCVFNLLILAVLDLLYRHGSLYQRAGQGHVLSAGFGVVSIAVVGVGVLLGDRAAALAIRHVGVFSAVSVLVYLVAVRAIFSYERTAVRQFAENLADRYPQLSLRQATARYALAAAVVVGAGIWLPFIAAPLAELMAWDKSFVGTLFVAIATSLPELAVSLAALRIGALDMALANLLGSNLFNIVILAIDDLFFRAGPILSQVSQSHAISAFSGAIMSGLVIIAIVYRPPTRTPHGTRWISIALIAVFSLNACALYRYGE